MRQFKYILLFILSMSLFNSCLIDDTTKADLNDQGYNLAGFDLTRTSIAAVSDGKEYKHLLKVKVVGPTKMDLKNDITITIGADATSTAIEGTHFKLENPTVVLKASDNYLGYVEVTMITKDIVTPLAKAPILQLKVISATGDPKVMNSGKLIEVTMNYACYSNLAGIYNVHTVITRAVSGAVSTYDWTEEIKTDGVGAYRTTIVAYDGYVNPVAPPGRDGFTFIDACDVLSVPNQKLAEAYSNIVVGTAFGSHDKATGKLHIEYSVSTAAAAGNRLCVSDYTPVP